MFSRDFSSHRIRIAIVFYRLARLFGKESYGMFEGGCNHKAALLHLTIFLRGLNLPHLYLQHLCEKLTSILVILVSEARFCIIT
jgi:hypothetical protein